METYRQTVVVDKGKPTEKSAEFEFVRFTGAEVIIEVTKTGNANLPQDSAEAYKLMAQAIHTNQRNGFARELLGKTAGKVEKALDSKSEVVFLKLAKTPMSLPVPQAWEIAYGRPFVESTDKAKADALLND